MENAKDNTITTNNVVNFNHFIGLPGTFKTGIDKTIYESKLNNVFLANSIESDVKKEPYCSLLSTKKYINF
jgi:hypothetical protein